MHELFEQASINDMTLTNRFVRSATWEGMCDKIPWHLLLDIRLKFKDRLSSLPPTSFLYLHIVLSYGNIFSRIAFVIR